jgi:hypothetical protein
MVLSWSPAKEAFGVKGKIGEVRWAVYFAHFTCDQRFLQDSKMIWIRAEKPRRVSHGVQSGLPDTECQEDCSEEHRGVGLTGIIKGLETRFL